MKSRCLFWLGPSLCCLFTSVNSAFAQGTAFTYNGRLNNNGVPVNAAYALRFTLYDANTAGTLVAGPLTLSPVDVVNGLFTARVDFGAGVFTGPPRWLSVEVQPASGGGFALLAPRQEVTAAPYAVRAANTGGAGGGGPWNQNGADIYYSAGGVAIGTSSATPGVRLEVNGTTKMNGGGSGGYVYMHTPSGESGMSIIGSNRADVRFDGSSLKLLAGFGPGAMPSENGITVDTLGNVGIGKSMFFGSQTRQMFNLFGSGFGIGVQAANLYCRSGAGFAWHVGGAHNDATYNSGGGTTVATLDLTTGLDFGSRLGQHLSLWGGTGARRFDIGMQAETIYFRTGNGVGDAFAWYKGGVHDGGHRNAGGGQTLMTLDGETGLFVSGPASVSTLTIRAGADLAEPFPMTEAEIERGSVVVIDDEHPGQLKLSNEAYDTRVAGIVSGANGVNPGIALHQEGVLDRGQNVALSGRVYVRADATFGAIKPGDLLTTSATPGHAMKVSDHGKAQGAILGKAMSGLKAGKGLVLVLVTLQ